LFVCAYAMPPQALLALLKRFCRNASLAEWTRAVIGQSGNFLGPFGGRPQ